MTTQSDLQVLNERLRDINTSLMIDLRKSRQGETRQRLRAEAAEDRLSEIDAYSRLCAIGRKAFDPQAERGDGSAS